MAVALAALLYGCSGDGAGGGSGNDRGGNTVFESNSFLSDLRDIYRTNGAGVYVRDSHIEEWRYEGGGN
jgi:hypothetical protein